MKLLSATVRSYRIHRETTVEFDESRCLIGGPNESGKSTFIEAVHRGLFLKSRITGDAQRSMVSYVHPGHPEVEVSFTVEGEEYHLIKRFSGSSGTTKLTEIGGASWQGDEAESRLNALLQVEDVGGGRNVADRTLQQWAHLWVWQGKSGNDPCADAASEQTALLQRLQDEGGAVAMQSQRDAQVAAHFAQRCASLFTQAGKPKAGSELEKAQSALDAAQSARQSAATRLDRLVQSIKDFEDAEETINRCTTDLESLTQQRNEIASKLSEAEKLKSQEEQQAATASRAEEKHADLKNANDQIESLRKAIHDLEEAIAPKLEECEQAKAKRQTLHERAQEAAEAYETAVEKARGIRQCRELARAWVERFGCEAQCEALSKRTEEAQKIREAIKSLRDALAELPEIDADALEGLRDMKSRGDQAKAALDAMASGIEVLDADQVVRIGDQEAPPGSTHTVTEAADVFVGDNVHLRIQPGGGSRLSEAREEVRAAKNELSESLDALGLESLELAVDALARRDETASKLEREESRLEDLDDGSLADDLAEAQEALVAAKGEVERRLKQVPEVEAPANCDEALAWRTLEDGALEHAEEDETERKAEEQAVKTALEEAENAFQAVNTNIEQQRERINNKKAQLRLLIENHGDDESRLQTLNAAAAASAKAQKALTGTRNLLDDLQPDQLEQDRDRLERAVQAKESEKQSAVEQRATSRAALTLDGSEDPQADLIFANAREQAAREHYRSVLRKTEAVKLLNLLFEEQQKVLADRFTQPLAERISDYLKGIFGPAARAVVAFEDGAFKGIQLVRPEHAGALSFDVLSGGTREQVAAAVRLAIAEVLAADHGDSLPVVFDDSFAFSDPNRVQNLQRMLDLAATRGLQVIVLTSNPSDYAALGARQSIFSPSSVQMRDAPSTSAGKSEDAAEDTGKPAEFEDPTLADEADCETLTSALAALGGRSGNKALREHLGWTDERYLVVKNQLIKHGRIVRGKGRGGSVALQQ